MSVYGGPSAYICRFTSAEWSVAALNIKAVYRLRESVKAALATSPDDIYAAKALAETYDRLRDVARELNEAAGWSPDEFDREIPARNPSVGRQGVGPRALLEIGANTRVLLGQLGAWAEGNVQVFEFERKLEIEAKAKAEAAQGGQKAPFGFNAIKQ